MTITPLAAGTWVAASDLRPGDELRNAARHTGTQEPATDCADDTDEEENSRPFASIRGFPPLRALHVRRDDKFRTPYNRRRPP